MSLFSSNSRKRSVLDLHAAIITAYPFKSPHVVSGLDHPAYCVRGSYGRSFTMQSSPPIRVGFVLHGLQVAGAEVLVTQIIQQLRGRVQPTVFCLDNAGALSEQLSDVEIISLDRRPGWDFRVAWRMAGHIRRLGIEVLHAHQYSPFFYGSLAKVIAGGSVRLVFTEHGRHFPDRVSPLRRAGNRLLLQHLANAVNAVSAFSANSLASQDGFCRHQIEVIENGIDIERFHSAADFPGDLDHSRRYIVHVARFHPVKDQATLLKAFEHVAKTILDVDLLMVGDGELRNELMHLAKALGLEGRVRFLGIRQDIPAILRSAKVFVLTSRSEGAPLTLLEAMAVGLPVVVTAVGGMPEIVRDGVDGILAPRGDANAIASALIRLLENPAAASAMGATAAQRIREHYTIDRAVDRYYRLYARLAGRA